MCTWPTEEAGREQAPEMMCLESVTRKDDCIDVAPITLISASSFAESEIQRDAQFCPA